MGVERTAEGLSSTAEAWVAQLDRWIDERGLLGYDRFDARGHPWLREVQPYPLLRKAASALVDFAPSLTRHILRIKPQLNAKAYALVALGHLRLFQATGEARHLDRAEAHLLWLLEHPSTGYHGLCWGYPFHVAGKGVDTPPSTPVVVVSTIAGDAFTLAFRLTGCERHLRAAESITEFLLHDIPRLKQSDGAVCFAYTPGDRRRVHNASLHAAGQLLRVYAITHDERLAEAAWPAVEFSLRAQRKDGSWPYGEHAPEEPLEAKLLAMVDHHHTGFVLRSLREIHDLFPSEALRQQLVRGFAFYREHLFEPTGMPITCFSRYPVDIHACAEGILCPAVFSDWDPGAAELSRRAIEWTSAHLRHPRTGVPYLAYTPWLVSKLYCPRWGLAWIFYALAEHLYRTGPRTIPHHEADAGTPAARG